MSAPEKEEIRKRVPILRDDMNGSAPRVLRTLCILRAERLQMNLEEVQI